MAKKPKAHSAPSTGSQLDPPKAHMTDGFWLGLGSRWDQRWTSVETHLVFVGEEEGMEDFAPNDIQSTCGNILFSEFHSVGTVVAQRWILSINHERTQKLTITTSSVVGSLITQLQQEDHQVHFLPDNLT
jgi:hypothetical protein